MTGAHRWLLVTALLFCASAAHADEVVLRNVAVEPTEGGAHALNADFEFELNGRLEDALDHGVTLDFVIQFECIRPRWYWFDKRVASRTLNYRLLFHALTRQYRVSSGGLHQNFSSLADALAAIGRVRGWTVFDRDQLKPGDACNAGVRLHLDTNRLPKPFQVRAITDRDWTVDSDWTRWHLVAQAPQGRTP